MIPSRNRDSVQLIQPRHVYAPDPVDHPLGHVYMPTSILSVQARLMAAGFEVELVDENIDQAREFEPCVGINLVGAPYVEPTIRLASRVREQRPEATILLGGQIISGFTEHQMADLFGGSVVNGNSPCALSGALGLGPGAVPTPESVSLLCAYEQISDATMRLYLSQEFAFYLSQGCRYSCSFCAADRTRPDSVSGGPARKVQERYRELQRIQEDLTYLIERSKKLGISSLQLYLTNLDLFQSPSEVRGVCQSILSVLQEQQGFKLRMRGLSNVNSFLSAHMREPDLIADLARAGLCRIGFGVDGAVSRVWKAIRKPHGSYSPAEAIRVARECYGITAETLMVFGHVGVDDADSLERAAEFGRRMADEHGALPRPHVAKGIVPGNDGWFDPANRSTIRYFLDTPRTFQLLDFTALPAPVTHPDAEFRHLVTHHFLNMCELKECVTQYVLPEDPHATRGERERAMAFNVGRYDL